MQLDFAKGNLGVRVFDNECVVIERKPGNGWVEDGQRFRLPLPAGFDSTMTTLASRLAIAFKAYERAHPSGGLRVLLTQKPGAEG